MQRIPPEDSPKWKDIAHEMTTPVVLVCRLCGKTIELWHCADSGCPWCIQCGANAKSNGKK